jgi:hypothetical protein
MLCPYCQSLYTIEQPCLCQPPTNSPRVQVSTPAATQMAAQDPPIGWNACRGNRIE